MKIAIFIDGKNFHAGWRQTSSTRIDFQKFLQWLVKKSEASSLQGAWYYTGVEVGENAQTEQQRALNAFLDMMEMQDGFFVRRFPRRQQHYDCNFCGKKNDFTQEKQVDTSLTADMIYHAAIGAYDVAVLISGDADMIPAIETVQKLGKRVLCASFSGSGMSAEVRKACFGHIDMSDGSGEFESAATETTHGEHELFLSELAKAQERFGEGYVGVNYFVTRWASNILPSNPSDRRITIDQLSEAGLVEIYEIDGKKAIRIAKKEEEQ